MLFCVAGTPGEPPTDAERQAHMAYEEWLMRHSQWLALQITTVEKQVRHQQLPNSVNLLFLSLSLLFYQAKSGNSGLMLISSYGVFFKK